MPVHELVTKYGSPLWIYDSSRIRRRIADLRQFDVIRYAQKANSNVHILKLMLAQGVVVDAVSAGEVERSVAAGFDARSNPPGVVFTADVIDKKTLALVLRHGISVNAGSLDMLEYLGANAPAHGVWIRVNPGFGHGHSNKTNTGGPHSKHGIWHTDVGKAVALVKKYGLRLEGIHMHIGSGVDYDHLARVCVALVEVARKIDCDFHAISAGGGLSVPYMDGDVSIDTNHYFRLWDEARREVERHLGHDVRLEIEPGRFLLAEAGILVSEVLAVKQTPEHRFVLVDAGFNDLVRPSMYGSYHEISVLPAKGTEAGERPIGRLAVGGPLCEAGDVFTQGIGGVIEDRLMSEPRVGDHLIFHDAGAYGASMSSNYNSKPLAPEILWDGSQEKLIRRRQTIHDLMALEDC
ncbi:diaminopimelate decarboxylase [Pandoraea sp. SD6-2]|uniref:diaminopimelate decarboxylase n=1 Tax=Pandoraea sp. SD6-2 TaxID=1286093 RepID=UPI0005653B1E|nr:diaminopimelate decarboxylase [Pandoraea sp. SD6-2]